MLIKKLFTYKRVLTNEYNFDYEVYYSLTYVNYSNILA